MEWLATNVRLFLSLSLSLSLSKEGEGKEGNETNTFLGEKPKSVWR
jgi:hypothetical protein